MTQSYLTGRRNAHDSPWTSERDALLVRLWTEGYSASQIANQIKDVVVSRMAVIGRANRLKLPPRKPRNRSISPSRRKPQVKIFEPKPNSRSGQFAKVGPNLPPRMRALSLFALEPMSCRWPIGNGPQWLFCAADVGSGEVYCPFHGAMARVREKRRV